MAPSKWEEEEESTSSEEPSSPRVYAPRRKFDDEEDSDEVLDSWDAAEDSDVEREKAAKAAEAKAKAEAEAAAKKKSKAQRIEEHKQSRRKQAEEEEDESSEEEDLASQRARLKRTEKESDLHHAEDLFSEIDLNQKRSGRNTAVVTDTKDPTNTVDLSSLPLFKPTTKTQFTTLTNTLVPLLTAQSKKPQYAMWVQDFARQLVKEMPSSEIRKAASVITTAANEKLKEEKTADKAGKKTKAAKTKTTLVGARDTSRAGADLTAYDGGDGLDDDDFM